MNIADEIRKFGTQFVGVEIPKPKAKKPFVIKGLGKRRNAEALIYLIPSHTDNSPYQKGVTIDEFSQAYSELNQSGEISRQWFNNHLIGCAKEGSCNFTTIGGIFTLLKIAEYSKRGCYTFVKQ